MIQLGGRIRLGVTLLFGCVVAALWSASPAAQTQGQGDWLCDNSYQDCRQPILDAIDAETVGIDVSMWFMDDFRYVDHLIAAWKRGVAIRVIVDPKADTTYPGTKTQRDRMVGALIPIRRYTGSAINHWKVFIFEGQVKMNFSAANFSNGSYSPISPYTQYVDEAIYFTNKANIVDSFITKFEDRWTNTTKYADFANITAPPTRKYNPPFPIDPDLNFVPDQNYENRLKTQVDLEGANAKFPDLVPKIDVVMFRITSARIPDALIARAQAGVPVRLINEEQQYRNTTYFWDSYNMDRMYMACAGLPAPCQPIQLKFKNNITDQDVHQKSIILYNRALSATPKPMVVFGSSNWTASSASSQEEHNYFSTQPWMVDWFSQQFERKWNNLKADGTPIGTTVFKPFKPLPPDPAEVVSPANNALGVATASVTLKWEGGWWAHKYDVYLDTTPTFSAPIVSDFMPGSATAGVVSTKESYTVTGLLPGTTYYWKIVSKTMANQTKASPTWQFTTMGDVPPPPAPTGLASTFVSSTRIDLGWNDTAGEQGYKIERKLSTDTAWTQIATTGQDVATYSDVNSGLKPDTTYNYRVRGFTSGGNSPYSNTVTVKTSPAAITQSDVVLYAANAPVRVGKYTVVADTTAAGGQRLDNPDAAVATVTTPLASPTTYIEMSFSANAGVPYRLWIRGKAQNNSGYNDSLWVQFSDAVTSSAQGAPSTYQIGSSSGTWVNLQDCSGCTVQGWGWQDNGFAGAGPQIFFAASGTHKLRIQPREDGFSIDQIVLSPATYLNAAPGALKGDTVILQEQGRLDTAPDTENPTAEITGPIDGATVQGSVTVQANATDNTGVVRTELWVDGKLVQTDNIAPYAFTWDSRPAANGPHTFVVRAYDGANNPGDSAAITVQVANPASDDIILFASQALPGDIHGSFSVVSDTTAATGARMYNVNAGAVKVATPSTAPVNYFEMTFTPQPNVAYHLWMRMQAESNNTSNDSVYVQFTNALDAASQPLYQIGTSSAASVILEDASGAGVAGWGWNDNGWAGIGTDIYFSNAPGESVTIRIQQREDGVSIDQILLSSGTYLGSAPGALKNDNTKLQ